MKLSKPATDDHRVRVAAAKRAKMRSHLVDVAVRLIADEGPGSVSIDRLIDAAGVARGTFYNYFATPAELMQAVGLELTEGLISTVDLIVKQHDDPAERVSTGMRAILACARGSPVLAAIIMQSGWPVAAPEHALYRLVARDVTLGLKSGRFRSMPHSVAMALVGGLAVGVMPAFADGSTRPDVDEQVAETMLLGLGLTAKDAAKLARVPFEPVRPDGTGLLARLLSSAVDD